MMGQVYTSPRTLCYETSILNMIFILTEQQISTVKQFQIIFNSALPFGPEILSFVLNRF